MREVFAYMELTLKLVGDRHLSKTGNGDKCYDESKAENGVRTGGHAKL